MILYVLWALCALASPTVSSQALFEQALRGAQLAQLDHNRRVFGEGRPQDDWR